MTQTTVMTPHRFPFASTWVFAVAAFVCSGPLLADSASQSAQLALLLRQLDTLEQIAQDASKLNADSSRYHFDYDRLHADIARVRAGISDYLTPKRAQPRDAQVLIGQYRTEGGTP